MAKLNFIVDTVKTLISTLLITFSLQIITYPFINHEVGNSAFGKILTIYTILTVTSVVLSNTLNNIRLINVNYFRPDAYYSVFATILGVSILVESIGLFLLFEIGFHLNIFETLCLLFLNLLMCLRIYLNVFFRMTLKYNQILLIAIFQFIGMMLGLLIFKFLSNWVVIFIVSELFAVIYTLVKLKHLSDPDETVESKNIVKDFIMLLNTNGLNNINLYLDRLILLPIIGSTAVTISFVSTFIGKMLATFLYPINNVILSYISVNESENIRKQYLSTNIYCIVALTIVMVICYPLTIFIVSILYHLEPSTYSKYIVLGDLGVLFNAVSIMIQTLNTKHSSITKQSNFITLHTILYIVGTIILTISFGLEGFFWSTLIANVIKYIALNIIGVKTIKIGGRK